MHELIKVWRKAGFTLRLYDLNKSDSLGKSMLAYEFKDGRKVIFAGEDYSCSPMHTIDSLESVMNLLGFLSVGVGDVDPDYFRNYTPEQLAWRDSDRRETLAMIVCEAEDRLDARRRAHGATPNAWPTRWPSCSNSAPWCIGMGAKSPMRRKPTQR